MSARIKRRLGLILLAPCALLLLTLGLAVAAAMPSVDWRVLGSGGEHVESGAYAVDYTLGQPVVGANSSGVYDLCVGFWCGAEIGAPDYPIYLPVLSKSF